MTLAGVFVFIPHGGSGLGRKRAAGAGKRKMAEISIGLVAGLLIGLTGVGVGSVMTALLVVLTPISTLTAIGTSLAVGTVTKMIGVWERHKVDQVNWRLAAFLLAGSVPGTLLGGLLLSNLKGQISASQLDSYLNFGLAFTMAATALVLVFFGGRRAPAAPLASAPEFSPWQTLAIGLGVGILVSLTSIGSGSVTLLLLVLLFSIPASGLVGTDIFYGLVTVASAAAIHLWMGHVDGALWLKLLVGSVPGVVIGTRLAGRLPEKGYGWISAALYVSIAARLVMR